MADDEEEQKSAGSGPRVLGPGERTAAEETPVPRASRNTEPGAEPRPPDPLFDGIPRYGLEVRAQVFEVIVRQALAGAPWREICAGPMATNQISEESVEQEVERRLNLQAEELGNSELKKDPQQLTEAQVLGSLLQSQIDSFITPLLIRNFVDCQFDLNSVENAIENIYKRLGFAKPKVFVMSSPFQFQALPVLQQIYKLKSKTAEPKQVLKLLKAELHPGDKKRFWEQFDLLLKTASTADSNEAPVNLSSNASEALFKLRTRLGYALNSKIGSMKSIQEMRIQNRLGATFARIKESYFRNLDSEQKNRDSQKQLSNLFQAYVFQKHLSAQAGGLPQNYLFSTARGSAICAGEIYWIALHKLAAQIRPDVYSEEETGEINDFFQLMNNGFAFLFMNDVCYVLRHPKVTLDDRNRPHSETEAAINFGGQEKIYLWHGFNIPRFVIENRKLLHPLYIDTVSNLELRRILIEIYGWEKYLRSFGSKLIHQDKYGKLYRRSKPVRDPRNMIVDEPVVAVEVTNSTPEPDGSYKRYMLRVPPNMTTAHEAVAWTFGLRTDEYQPDKES